MKIPAFILLLSCSGFGLKKSIDNDGLKILFKPEGKLIKIDHFATFKYKIFLNEYLDQAIIGNEDRNQILSLCTSFSNKINCEILEAFIDSNQNETQLKRTTRNYFTLGYEMQDWVVRRKDARQRVIDNIQNDIRENREILKNHTKILNETLTLHSNITKRISNELRVLRDELNSIKNETVVRKAEHAFLNTIQSLIMSFIKNSDISDALLGLLFQPSPTQVAKLVSFKELSQDLVNYTKNTNLRFANANGSQIMYILLKSKIRVHKDIMGINLFIDVPVTSTCWNLYSIYPLSFLEGGEAYCFDGIANFIAVNNTGHHSLLTYRDWTSCVRLELNEIACSLPHIFDNGETCEIELLSTLNQTHCSIIQNRENARIIQFSESRFFINTNHELKFDWGINGSDESVTIGKNMWIDLEPGEYMRVLNKIYRVPLVKSERILINKPLAVNITQDLRGPEYIISDEFNGTLSEEFGEQFKNISQKIDYSFNRTSKEIKSIILPSRIGSRFLLWGSLAGVVSVILGLKMCSITKIIRLIL